MVSSKLARLPSTYSYMSHAGISHAFSVRLGTLARMRRISTCMDRKEGTFEEAFRSFLEPIRSW